MNSGVLILNLNKIYNIKKELLAIEIPLQLLL